MASIQGIYLALFGRPADPAGLAYFNGITNNGANLAGISNLSGQPEYTARFTGMTNTQIVNSIYQSLFGRDGETAGINFFVGKLASGELSINNIAIAILDGAQGADKTTIDAKIAAANLFTTHLDLPAEQSAYSGATAINLAKTYIATINSSKAGTDTDVDALIQQILTSGGQAPGGGDGGNVGGGGGGGTGGGTVDPGATPSYTLIGAFDQAKAGTLPSPYAITPQPDNVGARSVADINVFKTVVANAANSADYNGAGGFSYSVADTLANLKAAPTVVSGHNYAITDASLAIVYADKTFVDAATAKPVYSFLDTYAVLKAAGAAALAGHDYAFSDASGTTFGPFTVAEAKFFVAATNDGSYANSVTDVYTAFAKTAAEAALISNSATTKITVNGENTADTIDFSAFTKGVTINGGAGADVITGTAQNDVIAGGAGKDTINLASGGLDVVDMRGVTTNDSYDTINGFSLTGASNADKIQFSVANTVNKTGFASYDTSATAVNAPQAGSSFSNAVLNLSSQTSAAGVVELNINLDFDGSSNKLNTDTTSANALFNGLNNGDPGFLGFGYRPDSISSITVTNGWKGYLIAYDANKAYIYYADNNTTGLGSDTLTASEIKLVGEINGTGGTIGVGALDASHFSIV